MACIENICTACDWYTMSNSNVDMCPWCGERVNNYFDEPPEDFADQTELIEDED